MIFETVDGYNAALEHPEQQLLGRTVRDDHFVLFNPAYCPASTVSLWCFLPVFLNLMIQVTCKEATVKVKQGKIYIGKLPADVSSHEMLAPFSSSLL